MSKFTYTLPSGDTYTVQGPPNATQAEADLIFYQQVAAGSLVGYNTGQTLSSVSVTPYTFELSRQQRGTAGVTNTPVLAVNGKADILNGVLASLVGNTASVTGNISVVKNANISTIVSIIQNLPLISGIPTLTNVPVSNAVTQVNVLQAKGNNLGPNAVGPLSPFQVQTLQAQASNFVKQPYNVITQEKGVGKYGFNCYQLETSGHVKPGTSAKFIESNPNDFVSTMYSPSIWTGQDGVNSLDDVLTNEDLQNTVQNNLMQHGYEGLQASGVITNTSQPTATVNTGWVYTGAGLQPTTPISQLGGDFTLLGSLLATSVTDYSTLGSGVTSNLSSNTINTDLYNYNKLNTTLTNTVNSDVGALVNNSAVYGPEITTAWANSGSGNELTNLINAGVNSINDTNYTLNNLGGLESIAGITSTNPLIAPTNSFGSITNALADSGTSGFNQFNAFNSELTNLPNVGTAITGALDILGKSSQAAMNFASEATSLGDLTSLDNLGNIASGALDNLGNLASSELNNLENLSSQALAGISSSLDSLSNLGDLASTGLSNLGNLANLGSLSGLAGKFGDLSNLLNTSSLGSLFGGNNALISGIQTAAGFSNTFNRDTLDAAVTRILGNAKITPPSFDFPSAESLASSLDISSATNFLADAKNSASGLLSSLGSGTSAAASATSNIPVFTQDQINRQLT